MSNISEQYRKALLTDETGKLISQKLGGETTEQSGVNTSAEFRKPLMSDETGKEILAKLDDIGGLPDVTEADNGNVLGVVEGAWAKMDVPSEILVVGIKNNQSLIEYNDILSAFNAGKKIVFQLEDDGMTDTIGFANPIYSFPDLELQGFASVKLTALSNKLVKSDYSLGTNGAVTKSQMQYSLTQI